MFQSLALSVSLSLPHTVCLSVTQSQHVSLSLPPQSSPFLTCLSFSEAALSSHLSSSLCSSLFHLLPPGPSLSKSAAAQGLLFLSLQEDRCLTERLAFKCDRRAKKHTCTLFFFLPDASRAHIHSQAGLMKLLRQILGRNSICREDERCDKEEREERRMKGQEEEKTRVVASGLMVHHDPALSTLLFTSEFL